VIVPQDQAETETETAGDVDLGFVAETRCRHSEDPVVAAAREFDVGLVDGLADD